VLQAGVAAAISAASTLAPTTAAAATSASRQCQRWPIAQAAQLVPWLLASLGLPSSLLRDLSQVIASFKGEALMSPPLQQGAVHVTVGSLRNDHPEGAPEMPGLLPPGEIVAPHLPVVQLRLLEAIERGVAPGASKHARKMALAALPRARRTVTQPAPGFSIEALRSIAGACVRLGLGVNVVLGLAWAASALRHALVHAGAPSERASRKLTVERQDVLCQVGVLHCFARGT
jgi:hypothetical protein